jgi:hypothetical protein
LLDQQAVHGWLKGFDQEVILVRAESLQTKMAARAYCSGV